MMRTWEEVAQTFEDAAALPLAERARFLDERCGADAVFRREVESLLEQDAGAGDYLEPPEPVDSAHLHGPSEGAVVGGFTLLRRIGSGGMGTVHEAQQTNPRRRVALKFLPPLSAAPGVRSRFELEAVLLGRMNHPSIAQVYAAGVDGHTPYIAMELVENALPITEYVRREALPIQKVIALYRSVCAAVAHAHAKGIVHRDLKPGNVLIDESGTPKLIDFGIAHALDTAEGGEQSLTRTGDLLGTPQYMSPEQADGLLGETSEQTDVYALGLVLYELVCGRSAHSVEGKSNTQVLRSVAEDPVPLARKVRPDLPAELEWILGKALEMDRARRYASVVEFDRDLENFLTHAPLIAGPRSRAYVTKLWVKRHPTATAVLTLFAASTVAVVWLAVAAVKRGREVFRLADAEKLRMLEREADKLEGDADSLWPATPDKEAAMVAWLDRAAGLTANMEDHRSTLAALRARALPRTEADALADASSHPDAKKFAAIEEELRWRRRAHERRTLEDPPPTVPADVSAWDGLRDWSVLNDTAMHLVDPTRGKLGDPEIAVALAERALAIDGCDRAGVLDTIAWAHFAAGDDDAAGIAMKRALSEGPNREDVAASAVKLQEETERACSGQGLADAAAWIAERETRAAELARVVRARRTWRFADDTDAWWHERLEYLVAAFEQFLDPERGLLRGVSPEHGLGVERRLAYARTVVRSTIDEPAEAWRASIARIAAEPRYGGLQLRPQLGLVPLGTDLASRLEEYADVATGVVPGRDEDGRLQLTAESAVVFVLLPAGEFLLGAQADDPQGAQYDPDAMSSERPLREWRIEAFFLAKHELTQAQWHRATGSNPSTFVANDSLSGEIFDALHPVETVSWTKCSEFLKRHGWVFPTEAQWEYAARAATTWPWWTGSEASSLQGAENLSDAHAHSAGPVQGRDYELTIDDGRVSHAQVGRYRANPFGLHDMCGNVAEWCRDLVARYDAPRRPGDGQVLEATDDRYVCRGGAYLTSDAAGSRVSRRAANRPDLAASDLGLRPARTIRP